MEKQVLSWEKMQELYPDRFVLIENPVFEREIDLKEGIFLYKHKTRMNVVKKSRELRPHYSTIRYTGGIRLDKLKGTNWLL
jgi:hypothetical protein